MLYEESLAISHELGNQRVVSYSMINLSLLSDEQGDDDGARARCEEALAIFREVGERRGIASSLRFLGGYASNRNDHLAAVALYAESIATMQAVGDRMGAVLSLEGLTTALVARGAFFIAAQIWGAAERVRQDTRAPIAPTEQVAYDFKVAEARIAASDDAAFDHAWQEGRAMSLEQAIELAVEASAVGVFQSGSSAH